ncbi:MAG: Tol-Pal system protein TolB [Waddliaceae bacterium]
MRFLFTILFCFSVFNVSSEHLFVQVETEDALLPIIVHPLKNNSDFSKALQNALNFDLNHNGMTQVVSPKNGLNTYEIKLELEQMVLTVHFISPFDNLDRTFGPMTLSGDIKKDRREIHQISDAIYRSLFGGRGIASSHLLYTLRNEEKSEVWESDYDGWNARRLTEDAGYCLTPAYLPPKSGMACGSFFYVSYLSGPPKIYVSSLQSSKGIPLFKLRGNQLMPAISPQRNYIAFVSDVGGNPDLFLQDFSPEEGPIGRPRQIFAKGLSVQGTPSFSPDETKLAFVSNQQGSPQIYIMEIPEKRASLKEMKIKRLTSYGTENTCPAWSFDGTKIAYSGKVKGVRQIFVYDCLKDEHRQITTGQKNKENPSWAPNSQCLVYNTSDQGDSNLYLLTLKDQKSVCLSSGVGDRRFPAWEPYR